MVGFGVRTVVALKTKCNGTQYTVMTGIDPFVLDPYLAYWTHEHLRNSGRFVMPDDRQFTYLVWTNEGQQNYFNWMDDKPNKKTVWLHEVDDMPIPEVEMDLPSKLRGEEVTRVHMSFIAYTTLGSWYTAEADEELSDDGAAFDPIRVPVTDDMIPEVREWVQGKGGTVPRVKGVEFDSRFAEVLDPGDARLRSNDLNDVHVKVKVRSAGEYKRVFEQATNFAERAVRAVV